MRTGSTKSLTFQVLNGKQITKDRVYNVKNPQTLAQMQQRALMATAVTAYSTLKEICDHSFEGIEVGSKTMGEFIKNNLQILAKSVPQVNVTEYKEGNFANNRYMISKGTLVSPNFKYEKSSNKYELDLAGRFSTDSGTTWGNLAEALGIKKDGMLTFVVVSEGAMDWLRIKFNEEIWNTLITKNESNINTLTSANAVEGNNLSFNDILVFDGNATYPNIEAISLTLNEGDSVGAIISEKSEGKWKRSTTYLDGNIKFLFEAGFATYPINTTLLLNGGKMSTNVITK